MHATRASVGDAIGAWDGREIDFVVIEKHSGHPAIAFKVLYAFFCDGDIGGAADDVSVFEHGAYGVPTQQQDGTDTLLVAGARARVVCGMSKRIMWPERKVMRRI